MTSGRASREARQQKVTERRLQVARSQSTRQLVRLLTIVVLLAVAIGAAVVYFLT